MAPEVPASIIQRNNWQEMQASEWRGGLWQLREGEEGDKSLARGRVSIIKSEMDIL